VIFSFQIQDLNWVFVGTETHEGAKNEQRKYLKRKAGKRKITNSEYVLGNYLLKQESLIFLNLQMLFSRLI
jgi:hypothetical protein